ncbi:MAG: G8 domain-containing protein, partial [Pseudomonadota bacterium]
MNAGDRVLATHGADAHIGVMGPVAVHDGGITTVHAAEPVYFQTESHSSELLAASGHEHSAVMALVSEQPTHTAVNNGNWFSPSTWQNNNVPNDAAPDAGARVFIPDGVSVTYNGTSDIALDTLQIDGDLSFASNVNSRLVVDTIVVTHTGKLYVGTAGSPIAPNRTVDIQFTSDTPLDPDDLQVIGRGLISMGTVEIHGANKTDWLAVDPGTEVSAGDTSLLLETAPSGWRVGDQLVISGTYTDLGTNAHGDENYHDEVRTITNINGRQITLNTALAYNHHLEPGFNSLRLYVANTTRNVSFSTQDWETGNVPTQQRAHAMFMSQDTHIENAGFYGMGRNDKTQLVTDPDGQGNGTENARGRYPIHLHLLGADVDDAYVEIKGNAVVDSPGWGYTIHGSKAIVEDNVSFDVVGAHFVTEDGNERTQFRRNIAIKSTGIAESEWINLLDGGNAPRALARDFGERGMGFWLDTSFSVEAFEDNVVTSTFGPGVIVYGHNDFHGQPDVPAALLPADIRAEVAGDADTIPAWMAPLQDFSDNTIYNAKGGFEARGIVRDDTGYQSGLFAEDGSTRTTSRVPAVVDGLTIWGVRDWGIHNSYASHLTYTNALVLGDLDDPIQRGGASPVEADGGGMFNQKNVRFITVENANIQGFENAIVVTQTDAQGYAEPDERKAGQMRIVGGHFENNTYVFEPADGRDGDSSLDNFVENPPFSLWTELTGNPVFVSDTPNAGPTAGFTSDGIGGLAVGFDGSASSDPDHPIDNIIENDAPGLSDQFLNTIAAYVWDFGDGQVGFGKYASHVYQNAGNYTVTLTVYDQQGAADVFSDNITVQPTVQPNVVVNGNFAEPFASANNGMTGLSAVDEGWQRPGGSQWNLNNGKIT